MLATIEQEELRNTLERDSDQHSPNSIMHELISPMLYLRLECQSDSTYTIHFGIDPTAKFIILNAITTQFLRMLFKQTEKESTPVNIEACIWTNWIINCCSERYEQVEERNK